MAEPPGVSDSVCFRSCLGIYIVSKFPKDLDAYDLGTANLHHHLAFFMPCPVLIA